MTERQPDGPDLGSVMGMGDDDVRQRLGQPTFDRKVDGEEWLLYATEKWRLRLRLAPGASGSPPRVRSLTLDQLGDVRDLPALLESLGLVPDGPVEAVPESGGRMLRCGVGGPDGEASLTARVDAGRVASITVFDEPPDWRGGEGA